MRYDAGRAANHGGLDGGNLVGRDRLVPLPLIQSRDLLDFDLELLGAFKTHLAKVRCRFEQISRHVDVGRGRS
jgi:hypothetical protein